MGGSFVRQWILHTRSSSGRLYLSQEREKGKDKKQFVPPYLLAELKAAVAKAFGEKEFFPISNFLVSKRLMGFFSPTFFLRIVISLPPRRRSRERDVMGGGVVIKTLCPPDRPPLLLPPPSLARATTVGHFCVP